MPDNCPERHHQDLARVSEMLWEKPDSNQSVNSDLKVRSYLQVREAPEARERLLATLTDIECHWGELAKFEAIVRSRKLSLAIADREREEKHTIEPNRAENLVQEPQDCDKNPSESEGKLELTNFYSVSQGQSTPEAPNATISESRGTEKENQRPDKGTGSQIGFGESEMRDLVPCILGPESQFLQKHSYSARDKVLLEMNLATRRSALLTSSLPSLPVVSGIDETLENTGNNKDQQGSAMMAGIHGGSAHSLATALTSAPMTNAFQVAQQPRTEGYWVNMDSEHDRTFTLMPTSRLIRSIDPDYTSEVFASRLVEQPACDLEGDSNGQTSIFCATIIDRRMLVGKPVIYTPGFLVVAGSPSDEKGCIQDRRDEKNADMNLAVVPVVRDRTGWNTQNPQAHKMEEYPLIELDVDYRRLHHITSNFELTVRNQLCQQIPDAVWQLGQGVLSPPAISPRRNTTISLGCEILRQVEWAGMAYKDPIIEPHLSQYPGHLKMLMDTLNRYQVYNLVADQASQFFLGNRQPAEGARAYAQIHIDEVLAKLPRNVVFTEREHRPELEAVWRTEQWANYPKVVQLNLSARPDEVSHTPGFQPQSAHGDDIGIDEGENEMRDAQVERKGSEERRNTTNGHNLTFHPRSEESSQRKERSNSLPLPLERLSLHAGPTPDVVEQESPQTSIETPTTPQIASQHNVEQEEGEISKLDDLDRLRNLPRHSLGSSVDASSGYSRTASERQRELDNHFDGSSGDEGPFKPTPSPLPPRHAKKPAASRNRKPKSTSMLLGPSSNPRLKFPTTVGPPGLQQLPQTETAASKAQASS
ncbi:hypothetical protein C8J56DRAFT_880822 [Mycena floridula]|nr:hypothetical protein C8J56DRAFT_880822 [Mycena floridula]